MSARCRGKPFKATLEYIAPKGVTDQGTIKFTIRAAVVLDKELFLRSNYSANADIVLDKREDVLAINEGNLIIEGDRTFVEVEIAPQKFEKREIKDRPLGRHQYRGGFRPGPGGQNQASIAARPYDLGRISPLCA